MPDWQAQLGGAALALSLVGLGVTIAGIWSMALLAQAAPPQPPVWVADATDGIRLLYRSGLVAFVVGSIGVAVLELEILDTIREDLEHE